jgi:hypothetical protein
MTKICQSISDALRALAMANPMVPDAPVRRHTLVVFFSAVADMFI